MSRGWWARTLPLRRALSRSTPAFPTDPDPTAVPIPAPAYPPERPPGGRVFEAPRPTVTYRGEDVSDRFTWTYYPPDSVPPGDDGWMLGGGWRAVPNEQVRIDAVNGRPTEDAASHWASRSWPDEPHFGPLTFAPRDPTLHPDEPSWHWLSLKVGNEEERHAQRGQSRDDDGQRYRLGAALGLVDRYPTWAEIEAAAMALTGRSIEDDRAHWAVGGVTTGPRAQEGGR